MVFVLKHKVKVNGYLLKHKAKVRGTLLKHKAKISSTFLKSYDKFNGPLLKHVCVFMFITQSVSYCSLFRQSIGYVFPSPFCDKQ